MKNEIVLILPKERSITYSTYRQSSDTVNDKLSVSISNNYEIFREPLGLQSIASYLREKGFKVKILFPELEELSDDDIMEYITNSDPLFVGFSVLFDRHLEHTLVLSSQISRLGIPVFLGGALASFAHKELLQAISWITGVVIGEGEESSYRLVSALQKGREWRDIDGVAYRDESGSVVTNKPAEKVRLCCLPSPSRDFLDIMKEKGIPSRVAAIYTSRGCPESCTYCTGNRFSELNSGKRWRGREVEDIVREVKALNSNYGVNYFYICDDNFIGYGKDAVKRLYKLAEAIVESGLNVTFHYECRVDAVSLELLTTLKRAGFKDILLGIESGVQSMLDRWKKRATVEQNRFAIKEIERAGLSLKPGFILFDGETSFEELAENIGFIKEMELHRSPYIFDLFNPIELFIGSECEEKHHKRPTFAAIEPVEEEIKGFIRELCHLPYEIDDQRVKLFWQVVRPIIDRLDYYLNYKLFGELVGLRKKLGKRDDYLQFLSSYKSWKAGIGDTLLDILFFTIKEVNEERAESELDKTVNNYYRKLEESYFPGGIDSALNRLLSNK